MDRRSVSVGSYSVTHRHFRVVSKPLAAAVNWTLTAANEVKILIINLILEQRHRVN